MNYFVTGTDTGVGKTYFTCGLIRAARRSGINCIGMKPICTGDNSDIVQIMLANDGAAPEALVNSIWYRTPISPYGAAMIEDRVIDLSSVRNAYTQLTKKHESVLVEGAGGILVPILADYDFRDLARDLKLQVILVSANRLGAINHTRLTLEAIRTAGLVCSLIALNSLPNQSDFSQLSNGNLLTSLVDTPVLELESNAENFDHFLWLLTN